MSLQNGLKVEGTGETKKVAKHKAAAAMLDIIDGKAQVQGVQGDQ